MSKGGLRVLVCGGRDYDGRKEMGATLSEIRDTDGISLIISGGATGADRLAERWANHNRVALCVFPANWRFEGKAAGPIRNARMLELGSPDLVVAFSGGGGTLNMIKQAESKGVRVVVVGARAPAHVTTSPSQQP